MFSPIRVKVNFANCALFQIVFRLPCVSTLRACERGVSTMRVGCVRARRVHRESWFGAHTYMCVVFEMRLTNCVHCETDCGHRVLSMYAASSLWNLWNPWAIVRLAFHPLISLPYSYPLGVIPTWGVSIARVGSVCICGWGLKGLSCTSRQCELAMCLIRTIAVPLQCAWCEPLLAE